MGQFHSPKNRADVLIYGLQLADKVGIYPMDAAWRKMAPPSLKLGEAHADLAALDQLRPRLMRLSG